MRTTSFTTYAYTLAAGATVKINRQFRHIRGLAGDTAYQVRFPESAPSDFQTGLAYNSPVILDGVEIINPTAGSIDLTVALADGPIDDNRLVGQIDISGGIRLAGNRSASYGAVIIGTSAAQIVAAAADRGTCLIQNLGANPIYIGSDNSVTTANGVEIAAGGSASVTLQTDIYGISGSAGNDVRYLAETL
jgi:hypothetical protein